MDAKENPDITLNLNLMDVNALTQALGKQPLEGVIELFMKIREQTVKQLQPPEAAAE